MPHRYLNHDDHRRRAESRFDLRWSGVLPRADDAALDGRSWSRILVGTWWLADAFGDVPPGMHQDEVSAGYDAYALLDDGYRSQRLS